MQTVDSAASRDAAVHANRQRKHVALPGRQSSDRRREMGSKHGRYGKVIRTFFKLSSSLSLNLTSLLLASIWAEGPVLWLTFGVYIFSV
jgi:hypothetical protein